LGNSGAKFACGGRSASIMDLQGHPTVCIFGNKSSQKLVFCCDLFFR
jgi:hypothetical protein